VRFEDSFDFRRPERAHALFRILTEGKTWDMALLKVTESPTYPVDSLPRLEVIHEQRIDSRDSHPPKDIEEVLPFPYHNRRHHPLMKYVLLLMTQQRLALA
jgi:hypothetical protein